MRELLAVVHQALPLRTHLRLATQGKAIQSLAVPPFYPGAAGIVHEAHRARSPAGLPGTSLRKPFTLQLEPQR